MYDEVDQLLRGYESSLRIRDLEKLMFLREAKPMYLQSNGFWKERGVGHTDGYVTYVFL